MSKRNKYLEFPVIKCTIVSCRPEWDYSATCEWNTLEFSGLAGSNTTDHSRKVRDTICQLPCVLPIGIGAQANLQLHCS